MQLKCNDTLLKTEVDVLLLPNYMVPRVRRNGVFSFYPVEAMTNNRCAWAGGTFLAVIVERFLEPIHDLHVYCKN